MELIALPARFLEENTLDPTCTDDGTASPVRELIFHVAKRSFRLDTSVFSLVRA